MVTFNITEFSEHAAAYIKEQFKVEDGAFRIENHARIHQLATVGFGRAHHEFGPRRHMSMNDLDAARDRLLRDWDGTRFNDVDVVQKEGREQTLRIREIYPLMSLTEDTATFFGGEQEPFQISYTGKRDCLPLAELVKRYLNDNEIRGGNWLNDTFSYGLKCRD